MDAALLSVTHNGPGLTLTPIPTMPGVGVTDGPKVTEAASLVSDDVTTSVPPIGAVYEDGGAKSIILIGVISATLLVFLCILLVLRFALKHKGSYRTNEDKEGDWGAPLAHTALRGSQSFEEQLDEDI